MLASDLHVFCVRSNPLRWKAPDILYSSFADHMRASGVHLHVVECAYGDEPFACERPGVNHIGVRAKTMIWCKENLLNIGIRRVPEAKYIAWVDSDILFRNPTWAADTVSALQLYDVVQLWETAYDLGPQGEHMTAHTSFGRCLHDGVPVSPGGDRFWRGDGGPYTYPHSGYAWAMTRQAFVDLGGLLDIGGMGSADFHMAQAFVGQAVSTMPAGTSDGYKRHVLRWQARAERYVAGNVGVVRGVIEHSWHGSKVKRQYLSRWDMFVRHGFDPDEDLKINGDGVFELAGNKPGLRRDFDRYLRLRHEDANTL